MAKSSTKASEGLISKMVKRVEKRIVPIEEAEPYLNILVYGRSGSGKTRFAATAPNLLIVDINEKGTRSARKFAGAQVYQAKTWQDVTYVYWYLQRGNHDFDSVALDTITGLQHMCMRHVLREEADRDPNKDPEMPTRREWGKLAELLKPLLLNFRNLPMNTIFTAQERVITEEDGGFEEHVPDLSPGSRGVAMAAVDVIGRMYRKEIRVADKRKGKERRKYESRMLVGPHEEYETKDRTGALGRIVRNPTVPLIIEAAFSEEE